MTQFLYFEPHAGASGDMILAALLGSGFPLDELNQVLSRLPLEQASVSLKTVTRSGLAAFRAEVEVRAHSSHRGLSQIEKMLESSELAPRVVEKSVCVFRRMAQAEAEVHGISVDEVHFHEVGADDAIIDVVGCVAGMEYLGAETVYCGAFPVGEGVVHCEHGALPNPAPATLKLLQGWPLRSVDCKKELITPTGAALLTTLARPGRPEGEFLIRQTALGAGKRDLPFPNVLRCSFGETSDGNGWERLVVLECHLDDCSGELLGYTMERLYEAGALEVSYSPVTMKKSRPGHVLFCLCRDATSRTLSRIILQETTTLGVRRSEVERKALERSMVTVETEFGELQVKTARDPFGRTRVSPEFEQARALAAASKVSLQEVYQAARRAFQDDA